MASTHKLALRFPSYHMECIIYIVTRLILLLAILAQVTKLYFQKSFGHITLGNFTKRFLHWNMLNLQVLMILAQKYTQLWKGAQ